MNRFIVSLVLFFYSLPAAILETAPAVGEGEVESRPFSLEPPCDTTGFRQPDRIPWLVPEVMKNSYENQARQGGQVTIALSWYTLPASSLQPFGTGLFNLGCGPLVFETLLEFDLSRGDFRPLLCDRYWVSPGRDDFYFHIDPEARWADGGPVRAADVVASLEFLARGEYRDTTGLAFTRGFKAMVALAPDVFVLSTWEADWGLFFRVATELPIFPPGTVTEFQGKGYDPQAHLEAVPAGSGPYRFAREKETLRAVFRKRPRYWAESRDFRRGLYNFREIRCSLDPGSPFPIQLSTGDLDLFAIPGPCPIERVFNREPDIRGWIRHTRVACHTLFPVGGILFNPSRPPLDSLLVRKALTRLFDWDRVNRMEFFEQKIPGNSIWAGTPFARGGEAPTKCASLALDLLGKAGWTLARGKLVNASGTPFELTIDLTNAMQRTLVDRLLPGLAEGGITVTTRQLSLDEALASVREGSFTLHLWQIPAQPVPDPTRLFHSRLSDARNMRDFFQVADDRLDSLCQSFRREFDFPRKVALGKEIDGIVARKSTFSLDFFSPFHHLLYWDRFGHPEPILPEYCFFPEREILRSWWIDEAREEVLMTHRLERKSLPLAPESQDPFNLVEKFRLGDQGPGFPRNPDSEVK